MRNNVSFEWLHQRRHLLWIALLTCALLGGIFYLLGVLGSERTQDAYVQGNIVQVTSEIPGTVLSISADNTDTVAVGVPLVRLNPVDYQIELDRAEAALASATRAARIQFHQVEQAQAELRQRSNDLARARQDQQRRQQVAASGAVSGEELQHTNDVVRNAADALEASRQQLAQRQANTDGLDVAGHPDVLAAASRLRAAYIGLHRTTISAPVAGTVSRRNVQVGQHIAAGATLMSVIPMDQMWVEANFKESQLEHIRIGQPVTMTTDLLGDNVPLHGRVLGLDAGTGSAFSLLPAQNATGNWIKVTQRVPVRISLDRREVARYRLRIGLSVHARVDIREGDSTQPAAQERPTGYGTGVFDHEMRDADVLVRQIIARNAGDTALATPVEGP
ncbi:MAG: HlyD family efflux transporter periplasmic adaptor subunit [Oxalobacteraceae bacterium]|nr:MAG: HlyD family efflux transporter periplasmic adaptor subunit [Oxalobacteraceae bacterium]